MNATNATNPTGIQPTMRNKTYLYDGLFFVAVSFFVIALFFWGTLAKNALHNGFASNTDLASLSGCELNQAHKHLNAGNALLRGDLVICE